MAILIKGMEMPKNCNACLFDNGVYCMVYEPSEDMIYDIADGKPDWCPLIEIPEPKASITREDLEAAGFET